MTAGNGEVRSFSLEWYEANRKKPTSEISPYEPVAGWQVKEAVLKTDIKYFNVRDCGICMSPIGYYVQEGDLVFDGSCDCCRGENFRTDQWYHAAVWINMQSSLSNRIELMKKFALLPTEYEIGDEHQSK